jgi:hypothetical protein
MRYRKTYKAQSDTLMMISLTDCLQQCLPSNSDAAVLIGTPSRRYVRVMKDRLATVYAKILFFST